MPERSYVRLNPPESYLTWGQTEVTVAVGETATVTYSGSAPDNTRMNNNIGGIATATVGSGSVDLLGVSEGTVTIAYNTEVGNAVRSTNPLTITVTTPAEDDKFLNKRGLTHFWENIDEIKQDKLIAGTNITIASDNTISASQPTVNDATLTIQRNGTNVQTFTANASSNVTANISVPTKTSDLTNDGSDNTAQYLETDETAYKTASIPYGQCDSTSTATVFTATVPGVTELRDGVCMWLKNGVVTSASGFTIDINNLGAKPVYNNMAAATRDTTIWNINYTMFFVYDSTRVEGGCWILYRGYNSDNNTIGYQVRTNSQSLPMTSVTYRYRLLFTSADNEHYVPANNSTSTNATASRTVCQDKINPFGRIFYYGTTASVAANARPGATALWEQYAIALGYSFNRTGAALTLTSWKPVYIKAAPQSDGSAIIDSATPYVQDLPTTEDGKIYIFLGVAYSATNIELQLDHPVYWYKDGAIRLWCGPASTTEPFVIHVTSVDEANQTFTATETYEEIKAAYDNGRFLTLEADRSNSSFDVTIHADLYQYISTNGTEGFTFAAYDASSDTQRVTLSKEAFSMYKHSSGPTYENSYSSSYGTVEVDATLNQFSSHAIANSAVATALATKADSSSLATVATSGSYNDLSNKPTIPTAGTITSGSTGYATGGDVYTAIGNVESILTTLNSGSGAS